jgi:hypothetical protein
MLHRSHPWAQLLAGASFALAAAPLTALPARAVVITVSGNSYDVLTTSRAYNDDPSLFNLALMPWYSGDSLDNGLAYDFAQAVFNQLGTNSYPPFSGGPLFAYAVDSSTVFAVFQDANDQAIQNEIQVSPSQSYNFAYLNSTPPTTIVPGPLPLIGIAAAFRWSRTLRSRQQQDH